VLLLDGNENQAVAAVRSLVRAGHEVRVGATERWSKAGLSRFSRGSFRYPSPRAEPDAFVRAIAAEAAREPGTWVLPMTEAATLPISRGRDLLIEAGARLALPDHDTLLRTFDKDETRRIAESLGVATPRSAVAASIGEARDAAGALGLPVVLKATTSEQAGPSGATAAGAPRYASSVAQLEEAFASLHDRAATILVQEFIEGAGTGYYALMDRGGMRAEFAHLRLRDVRPTGSGSAVRRSIAVEPGMRDASIGILEELGWHGVAMVEYKRKADGTLVFLEVNGRFWNSLALAIHAGVDFPALLARMVEGRELPPPPAYRADVRCRWLLGDARHLAAVMLGPPAGYPGRFPGRFSTLRGFLTPTRGMKHDNFEIGDPLPELGDWLHFFGRRVPAALRGRTS
jgi:predicted ATP-grasp superfamily ATP-dependent carboligase